jgi:hypothetical protein
VKQQASSEPGLDVALCFLTNNLSIAVWRTRREMKQIVLGPRASFLNLQSLFTLLHKFCREAIVFFFFAMIISSLHKFFGFEKSV